MSEISQENKNDTLRIQSNVVSKTWFMASLGGMILFVILSILSFGFYLSTSSSYSTSQDQLNTQISANQVLTRKIKLNKI